MAGSGGDQIIPDCGRMHTLSVKKGCWPSLSAFLACTSMGTLLLFASARSARRYPYLRHWGLLVGALHIVSSDTNSAELHTAVTLLQDSRTSQYIHHNVCRSVP